MRHHDLFTDIACFSLIHADIPVYFDIYAKALVLALVAGSQVLAYAFYFLRFLSLAFTRILDCLLYQKTYQLLSLPVLFDLNLTFFFKLNCN